VLLVAGLTIMLAGCGSSGTNSTAATGPLDGEGAASVVPSGGTVAGKGYPYWLERVQLVGFEGPFTPPSCVVVSAGGQRVALLFAHRPGHSLSITCSEPAGRSLYVAELFTVCSTLEGLPGFGTPPAELETCARSDFTSGTQKGVSYGVTLDGHPTRAVVGATGTYYVPKVVSGGLCGLACVSGARVRGRVRSRGAAERTIQGHPHHPSHRVGAVQRERYLHDSRELTEIAASVRGSEVQQVSTRP
jgi:hypothetical protein